MFCKAAPLPQTLYDELFLFSRTLTPAIEYRYFLLKQKSIHKLSVDTEYLIRRVTACK